MSNSKKGEWIAGKLKPVRVGVYQRLGRYGEKMFSYWDGSVWNLQAMNAETAALCGGKRSTWQSLMWRGKP